MSTPKVKQEFRFAVGQPEGPRSSTWRLWTHSPADGSSVKSEVYLASRTIAAHLKVSLHASGKWRVAFNKDSEIAKRLEADGKDRTIAPWHRPEPDKYEIVHAFNILFATSELGNISYTGKKKGKIHWIKPAPPEHVLILKLLISTRETFTSTWPGKNSGSELIFRCDLLDDEILWLVAFSSSMSDSFRSQLASVKTAELAGVSEAKAEVEPGISEIRGFIVMVNPHGAAEVRVWPTT